MNAQVPTQATAPQEVRDLCTAIVMVIKDAKTSHAIDALLLTAVSIALGHGLRDSFTRLLGRTLTVVQTLPSAPPKEDGTPASPNHQPTFAALGKSLLAVARGVPDHGMAIDALLTAYLSLAEEFPCCTRTAAEMARKASDRLLELSAAGGADTAHFH